MRATVKFRRFRRISSISSNFVNFVEFRRISSILSNFVDFVEFRRFRQISSISSNFVGLESDGQISSISSNFVDFVEFRRISSKLRNVEYRLILHKVAPGIACVRSTQITGLSLQSTDNNFSAQGTPWQCVRAFHTNNRVVSAVDRQRFLYTRRSLA